MKLYSTDESVRRGEPSLLAIGETLTAMCLSVWIGVHYGTWMHVALSACVTPFLLLRTEHSCVRGVKIMDWLVTHWNLQQSARAISIQLVITVPTFALVSRIGATLYELVKSPAGTLSAIPRNWWTQVIATDLARSPEWLPLPEEYVATASFHPESCGVYDLVEEGVDLIRDEAERKWMRIVGFVWWLSIVLLLGVPAILYRWSIKATAVVWFPLLWAVRPAKSSGQEWKTYLRIERDLKVPQLVAVLSATSLLVLGLKYIMWAGRHELALSATAWRSIAERLHVGGSWDIVYQLVEAYIRPGAFPLWQVAMAINGVLGVGLWWAMREWTIRFDHDDPPSDVVMARATSSILFVRRLLTSYIVLCDVLIAYKVARNLPMPEIGTALIPLV